VAQAPAVPQLIAASPALPEPVLAEGERLIELTIGPLERPETADHLAELFTEIPGLGRIEATDGGRGDAAGIRRFRVVTTTSDGDLLDLFSFHVDRAQVRMGAQAAPAAVPAAAAAAAAAPAAKVAARPAATEGTDFGFFVDLPGEADAPAAAPVEAVPLAAPAPKPAAKAADRPAPPATALESTSIRVPIEKVDQLINLVGELVITQAMLAQTGQALDPVLHQSMSTGLTDLERNTRMLQEAVMAIRMIPMAVVFNRFPRMLRDLAGKLGKQVELVIEDDQTTNPGIVLAFSKLAAQSDIVAFLGKAAKLLQRWVLLT
jgi:two-component system chemotaxis sensor kinase CheA